MSGGLGRPLFQKAGRHAVEPSPRDHAKEVCGGGGLKASASPRGYAANHRHRDDGDFLDGLLAGEGLHGEPPSADWFTTMCEERTFLTTPEHFGGIQSDDDDDEVLRKLQEAADGALSGAARRLRPDRSAPEYLDAKPAEATQAAPHTAAGNDEQQGFLRRLQEAYAQALAAGDEDAAGAVAEALRAEGAAATIVPPRAPPPQRRRPKPQAACGSAAGGCATAPQEGSGPDLCPRLRRPRPSFPSRSSADVAELGAGAAPSVCSRSPAGGAGDCSGGAAAAARRRRAARREQELALQAVGCRAAATTEVCVDVEPPEVVDESPQLMARLGSLRASTVEADVLGRAAGRVLRCLEESLCHTRSTCGSGLGLPLDASCASLPASELPAAARGAVAAWARGDVTGARCLLELEAGTPSAVRRGPPGRPTWSAIANLCGLASGDAFCSGHRDGLWTATFGQTPSSALRTGLLAVKAEAAIGTGTLSADELHLGLRALELRSKCAEGGGAAGGRIQAQTWRELFRLYLRPSESESESFRGRECLAATLRAALAQTPAGVEREATQRELQDDLRSLPEGWDDVTKALVGMSKCLKDALESIKTYGPYSALGVEVDSPDADLKKAYRELCLVYHPDKGGDTASFQQLQQAYETIVDDRKRGIRPPPPPPGDAGDSQQPRWQQQEPGGCAGATAASPAAGCSAAGWQRGAGDGSPASVQTAAAARAAGEPGVGGGATAAAAAEKEVEADARTAEAVCRIEELCGDAQNAAERARGAVEAAEAAAAVVTGACRMHSEGGFLAEAMPASLELQAALRAATEDALAAAGALEVLSGLLLPACGNIADGALAEEVLEAAGQCSTQIGYTSSVASLCGRLVDEVAETFRTVAADLAGGAPGAGGDSEARTLAAALLAAAAVRASEAAGDAALAAAAAAAVALTATSCVRRAARSRPGASRAAGGPRPAGTAPAESGEANSTEQRSGGRAPRAPAGGRSPPTWPGAGGDDDGRPPSGGGGANSGQRARQPGSARARSSSTGPRGWAEALVQRRVQALEEIVRLDSEVRGLQRELHDVLLRSPLLLRGLVGGALRVRLFGVLGEVLHQERQRATMELDGFVLLPFVATSASPGHLEAALGDARLATLRLAAVVDLQALGLVLREQLLPAALAARPPAEAESLRCRLDEVVALLSAWVCARER